MSKIATIILAAGKGTRMKSNKAKVTFELADKSLISRVVDTAHQINSDLICAIVGYMKESVIDSIANKEKLVFVEQKEQNGTGHAVIIAKEALAEFKGDVFILCGDVPLLKSNTLLKMYELHTAQKAACTVLTAILDDPSKYGRIVRDQNGNVAKIVEYKDADDITRAIKEINTGIYCFDCELLYGALAKINNNNNQNEYYLTDTLEILNKENKKVQSIILDDLDEAAGINSQQQLTELETSFYRRIKNHWLNNGVVIENPETVLIGEDVVLENDVTIQANVILKGKTVVKTDSVIGFGSYIKDAELAKGTILKGQNIVINNSTCEGEILDYQEKRI